MSLGETPAQLGYRWPAEWSPHAATWLAWPHNRETWPGKFEPVPAAFANMVRVIAEHEPVHILAGGKQVMANAQAHVGRLKNVILHDISTNDAWIRDHGPTFLSGPPGAPSALVDWDYNAWGGKYPPFDLDNTVPQRIAQQLDCKRFVPGRVLEGGAIEGNGEGMVITTPACVLDPRRNPATDRQTWERTFGEFLGAKKVFWLEGGAVAGDDTDGHIDQIARFVNRHTIVAAVEDDPADENYAPLRKTLAGLAQTTDTQNWTFEVIPLPMPRPKYFREQRLPASYANFYIANGLVIVPQFRDAADEPALEILTACFPDRDVVGLEALDLVLGLGAFHCLTQQEPMS